MAKAALTVLRTVLSLDDISRALRITPEDAVAKFQDARVTSWFAEIWGERLFNYTKHLSANHAGSDAAIALGDIGRFDIGVRCFNRSTLKFQKSKFIGSRRSASKEDLIASIEEVERYVVVDLRGFPTLDFYPLDTKALLRLVYEGKLTTSGISPARFDSWVAESFDVTRKEIEL
jgi:hypothetical protein